MTSKVSRAPRFEDKLLDLVGLSMNQHERSPVILCEEKSQIQTLNRMQPGPPMKRSFGDTVTYDCKRHGTTTLFAALNTLVGSVMSISLPRHLQTEWLKLLRLINRITPKHLSLKLVVDNFAGHSHPEVQEPLGRHPRLAMHFTTAGATWLNRVERHFRDITDRRIWRDSFASVAERQRAIDL